MHLAAAARAWDEQQHDLASARRIIDAGDTGGFSRRVAVAAEGFVHAWQALVAGLAATAGAEAASLRVAVADWVTTDDAAGAHLGRLTAYVGDRR
jgi:hypothetical protein